MFQFLKEKKDVKDLYAIVDGELIDIACVKDATFSQKLMGDGVAIIPNDDTIVSPCDCEVVVANENMKHALGLKLKNGIEILIHVGIDTVMLEGEGFKQLVCVGQSVKTGAPLLKFDSAFIKAKGYDDTVMMIITNTDNHDFLIKRIGMITKQDSKIIEIK